MSARSAILNEVAKRKASQSDTQVAGTRAAVLNEVAKRKASQ